MTALKHLFCLQYGDTRTHMKKAQIVLTTIFTFYYIIFYRSNSKSNNSRNHLYHKKAESEIANFFEFQEKTTVMRYETVKSDSVCVKYDDMKEFMQ